MIADARGRIDYSVAAGGRAARALPSLTRALAVEATDSRH
jgi:hypothetical protein